MTFANLDKRTEQMYKKMSSMMAPERAVLACEWAYHFLDGFRTRKTREETMKNRLGLTACVAAVFAVAGMTTPLFGGPTDDTPAKEGVEAKVAFKKLKTLVGSWKAKSSEEQKAAIKKEHGDDHPTEADVTFKLTGAGSALVETQFPGMPHEMVSVYHLDGNELRVTHYCAAGNQPRVKLDRAHSTPEDLIFVFDGGTNLDPEKDMHIHGVRIKFEKDGVVNSAWDGYVDGKKASTTTFMLSRKASEKASESAPAKHD
jgi:hypothetical protein